MTELLTIGTTAAGEAFTLPIGSVTQKFALFAQSGAGKSYAAMKMAEELLAVGAQVIALDPVGIWWGLRVAADGEGPGFPIAVFGGDYGDLSLPAGSGTLVADILVDQRIAAVLDVSAFELPEQRRFIAAFAERFFQRKKRSRSPVHLFLEEAQTFAPLRPEKDETIMLNRVERLARLGRNYGIGWTIISQRPQEVHTKVRNQAGTLIALRTIGPHERKAVAEWMDDNATTPADLDLVNELPTLATGAAHIYSPSFLKVSMRAQFGRRRTFDSSATPEDGVVAVEPRALAAVDVAALRAALEEAGALREQDDPDLLRRRIAKLEQQLRERSVPTVERVEVPLLDPQQVAQLLAASDQIHQLGQALMEQAERLADQLQQTSRSALQPRSEKREARIEKPTTDKRQLTTDAPQLRAGELRLLGTLARRHPLKLTRAQLGTLAGFSPRGGTFGSYLSTLKRAGFLQEADGELWITAAGLAHLGHTEPPAPQTTAQILAMWHGVLRAGERRMLDLLVAAYPAWRTRAWRAQEAGIEQSGGTFGTYLGTLRRNGLIEIGGDNVRASQTLFLSGEEGG